MTARGVDLDVVEQTADLDGVRRMNVIVPNAVSINGLPVLVPADTTIDLDLSSENAVVARLSLFVGRLRVHAEPTPMPDSDPPIFAALAAEMNL